MLLLLLLPSLAWSNLHYSRFFPPTHPPPLPHSLPSPVSHAQRDAPGYAIGGLAGGEDKASFWRVVAHNCQRLPAHKPRYLMGVGYPLDLVVCVALGVDMFDCVYPTRTARFGVALVPEGALRLKSQEFGAELAPVDAECACSCCRGYTRAGLHVLFKEGNALAAQLLTTHNVAYMMRLMR